MSEHLAVGSEGRLVPVEEGEFAGWQTWNADAFEQMAGPFYERVEDDGSRVAAFRAEARHMNGAGFMHGGCMMTFADSALFTIAGDALKDDRGVTMNLSGDFLDAARVGQLIEARGEVTRQGGRVIYVRGLVTADGTPVLSFTGIIYKVGKRAG